jgi:hypothetical protein
MRTAYHGAMKSARIPAFKNKRKQRCNDESQEASGVMTPYFAAYS